MKPRFPRLSVHRKLVASALIVSTAGLVVALVGLTIFDVWRYRGRAGDDTRSLAGLIAENTAAAVTFRDQAAAEEILSTVRVRSPVTRGCIYLDDGSLFASYARDADYTCPASSPDDPEGFLNIGASRPIVRNGRTWGSVYVERDFSGLPGRIAVTSLSGLIMLIVGSGLSYLLAQRLTRSISDPIMRLASEARRIRGDADFSLAEIPTAQDEVGDLVRAFHDMLARVQEANAGLLSEIEERKRIEAQRESLLERERETSRLKDEFVATVSHELRTPMSVILSWSQILEAAKPNEAMLAKAVAAISRSAGEQARIIDDLVDVSRIATGKLQLQWQAVDLRDTIEGCVESVQADAAAKNVRVEVDLPPRPCMVRGDPDRLRQLIGNLLSNAAKFTEPGGRISVATRDLETRYEVEISDTGIGIEPDVLPHIFDRYRQADSSTTRRFGGLGLGLSIVKELTELHRGSVKGESDGLGQGARFVVTLPALVGAGLRVAAPPASENPADWRLDGLRILAVDDNPQALEGLATALRSVGASVTTADSGAEAIEAWRADPPDILLCDLAMPGLDGFGVLARIREIEGNSAPSRPAIAVSAHATQDHRRRSIAAGFVAHIAKPYRIPDLVRAIRDATVPVHG